MKLLICLCLSMITLGLDFDVRSGSFSSEMQSNQGYVALAFTDKDFSIINRDRVESEIVDHYGSPEDFKHYIINLPTVRV